MNAKTLKRDFYQKVTFIGGIDTQDLLVNGTPEQIKEDVRRVMAALGPNVVISPSHECILSNVPFANIKAMVDVVME